MILKDTSKNQKPSLFSYKKSAGQRSWSPWSRSHWRKWQTACWPGLPGLRRHEDNKANHCSGKVETDLHPTWSAWVGESGYLPESWGFIGTSYIFFFFFFDPFSKTPDIGTPFPTRPMRNSATAMGISNPRAAANVAGEGRVSVLNQEMPSFSAD